MISIKNMFSASLVVFSLNVLYMHALWVQTKWNRRIQFQDTDKLESLWVSEQENAWAQWSEQCGTSEWVRAVSEWPNNLRIDITHFAHLVACSYRDER